jgi:hypothetical protein
VGFDGFRIGFKAFLHVFDRFMLSMLSADLEVTIAIRYYIGPKTSAITVD